MSQTFANTIDGNKIYADRAEHDAAGNDIQTTYATKSEVPAAQVQADWSEADSLAVDFIKNKPANLVQDASYVHTDNNFTTALKDKLDGIASGAEVNVQADWEEADSNADSYIKNKPTIPSVPVQDVEVDGTSVVNASGVAEITMPTFTQAQADWTESDTSDPSYIQNKPTVKPIAAGTNITITEAQGNIVISASGGAAQQQADWNQTNSSAVDYIKNKPTIPAAQVQSNWAESNSGSVSYIQNKPAVLPVIAGTNVTITQDNNGVTISAAGGTQVQADWTESDSSDPSYIQNKPANLVQDASYVHTDNNFTTSLKDKLDGIASGAEVNVQANWTESDSSSDSYIQNKPTIVGLSAGANVTITEGNDGITIAATDTTYSAGTGLSLSGTTFSNADPIPAHTSTESGKVLGVDSNGDLGWVNQSGGGGTTYTAGDGIDITSDVISADVDGTTIGIDSSTKKIKLLSTIPSVDQTYSAASANAQSGTAVAGALAGKEDAFDVGTGLEMDTSGATPTLQVEAPVDIVAGPGIVIDNPEGNTLRVSMAADYDVTLFETTFANAVGGDVTLSENAANFDQLRITYILIGSSQGYAPLSTELVDVSTFSDGFSFFTLNQEYMENGGSNTAYFIIRTAAFGIEGNKLKFKNAVGTSDFGSKTALTSSTAKILKVVGIHRIANN